MHSPCSREASGQGFMYTPMFQENPLDMVLMYVCLILSLALVVCGLYAYYSHL